MKKIKKIILLLLSILMIITALPLTAVNSFAADKITSGDYTYAVLDNGTAKITKYTGSATELTIPSVIDGYSVTSIGNAAFRYCESLTSITIPNSVTFIDVQAFEGCASLTSITIPDSVTKIGIHAFEDCTSLTSITIPNRVTEIRDGVFRNCTSLASITIPSSVTGIWDGAFENCTSLTSIEIPESVTFISSDAFRDCTSLARIIIPDSATGIYSDAFDNTAYYNDESNWNNGIFYIGNHLVKAKSDISGSAEIKQGTKTIEIYAFHDCASLTSITIPDSVTKIGIHAFEDCTSLTSITIPNSVTSISGYAFKGCISLASINIPDSITEINVGVFEDCTSLKSVIIPDSVTEIVDWAFYNCTSLASVTIPNSVTYIHTQAFWNCTSLMSITIPESVTDIDEWALGYYYNADENTVNKVDGFTIYGFTGSEAEKYANDSDFKFVSIGVTYTLTFPDVASGEWYYNAIKFNVDKGYFHGYANGYFGPGNNIQRQDFVVVLSKIAGADLSAYAGQNGGFSDVPKNDYYSAAVAWAKDNHILSGYANGKFGVGDPITREQACLIFYNYCNGYINSSSVSSTLSKYPDGKNVSDWARTAVAWAAQNNVVGGNGKLNPAGNANRAEMAQIIMNMSNNNIL